MESFSLSMNLPKPRIPIESVLSKAKFPPNWPYKPSDFYRQDETKDNQFYSTPRFVTHIDDNAIKLLTSYYNSIFFKHADVLDICSSWVSHYPSSLQYGNVIGLGMNEEELKANKQLTNYNIQDLNENPLLPYDDDSFDFVTCVVSVDYLTKPLQVFQEIQRVLRPNGKAIISQSNRCFPSKAIDIWLNTNDLEHGFIIGSYFHYVGGFKDIIGKDLSNTMNTDPMFIIQATKK